MSSGVRIDGVFVALDSPNALEKIKRLQIEQEKGRALGRLKDALREFGLTDAVHG